MRRAWRFIDWTARWGHVAAQVQFEPRDLWVGAFWRFERFRGKVSGWDNKHGAYVGHPWSLHVYVCIVPVLPLHVMVGRTLR